MVNSCRATPTTRIVLVRHGHVQGINPERFRGRLDLELTAHGRRQAQATATRIAQHWRPAIVYTSPLQRCVATARLIAEACAVSSVELDELIDIDYGTWQGKTHEEVRHTSPIQYRRWLTLPLLVRFPSGESLPQLAARLADALRQVIDTHPDDTIVIVGHDSTNRALLLQALGLPLSAFWRIAQDPCAVSEIVVNDDGTTVPRMNETAHLAPIVNSLA